MNLKEGDYVRHSRFGTGRVAKIDLERISVHQKNGNTLLLTAAEAENELRTVPGDGFYAFLYHKNPDPDFLRDNIEDIVSKMMRDRWSQSISLEEIKRELFPILGRQQKKWDSWWKVARKKLLASGKVQIDPQKKTRFVSRAVAESSPNLVLARIDGASDSRELLAIAREMQVYPQQQKHQIATELSQRVLKRLEGSLGLPNEISDLFCALCYAVDPLEASEAEALVAQTSVDLNSLNIPQGMEVDVVFALATLARISPKKAADLSKTLLSHSSVEVRTKAFSILNAEPYRHFLKSALLSWVDGAAAVVPPVELYLRKDFIRHFRQTDVNRLYLKVIVNPRLCEGSVVRQFLDSPELAKSVFNAEGVTNQERVAILSSTALPADLKAALVRSLPDPDAFLRFVLDHIDPNMDAVLVSCLTALASEPRLNSWNELLMAIGSGHYPQAFRALCDYVRQGITADSGSWLLTFAARASQLYELAEPHYAESSETLRTSLEKAGRRFLDESVSPEPLQRALQEAIREATDVLAQQKEMVEQEKEGLSTKLNEAQREAERLRSLTEMLKSSAGTDKHELEAQIRTEVYRPLCLLLDDFERQPVSGEAPVKQLVTSLRSLLDRAGVKRVGEIGQVGSFDPTLHEFLEEPLEVKPSQEVRIERPGYVLETPKGPRLVRRALVRVR